MSFLRKVVFLLSPNRIFIAVFFALLFSVFAFAQTPSVAQIMDNGDEAVFEGLSFILIDDGGAGSEALFELNLGNASSIFFAQKNHPNLVLGVVLFAENNAAGGLNVILSKAGAPAPSTGASPFPQATAGPLASTTPEIIEIGNGGTEPSGVLACLPQEPKSLIIERHSRVYQSADGLVSVVDFKVKNNSSVRASAFILKDDSGKQWLLQGLGPFEGKTFSFAVQGAAPSETPRASSVLVETQGIEGTLAYVVILVLIAVELFAVKKFLDARMED